MTDHLDKLSDDDLNRVAAEEVMGWIASRNALHAEGSFRPRYETLHPERKRLQKPAHQPPPTTKEHADG